ncbi:hypothetical protein [Sideroxydans lithotrophicus]|uniref:Uncharacterized protein n=1 Tax=Sideroxydans lithotrophicus (strain ES-1) TaxID=580332 RepID=D5CLH7_SIDLE|nr:hypothetical protein [Sideroxydans lithotrophicus]ADE10565.1 hypothetical protein Slit_0323 [Sideroxydans lithotrophicus ES-1]
MFSLFEGKPDHPLFDLAEARRLIAELPEDDHYKALEDITFWLDSIKTVKGFHPEVRAAIILLLDETALPLHNELLNQYMSAPHLQDFKGVHQWQGIHAYARALAEAYAASMEEYRGAKSRPLELRQQLPLLCVRWARAIGEQVKLELMRYLDVAPEVWRQAGACQRFIEAEQIAESMVLPYAGHVIHSSPQRELLRVLLLYVSAPDELAPDQIEVTYRIAGRLCSFFDLKNAADDDCPYRFDIAAGDAPHRVDGTATPDSRYFGAVRALPAVDKIERQNEDDPVWQERRFGSEFTPAGKLTVLKHLLTWWAPQPPLRHQDHRGIDSKVDVVHGFKLISQLVTRIELAGVDDADGQAHKIGLAADSEIDYTAEIWTVTDISLDEIGIKLAKSAGAWVKIGDLCGIKTQNNPLWWVGAIRRIHTDADNTVHLVIGIIAKKPLSIWLRALGKGAEKASNWETSSGSFQYTYLPTIVLPDVHNSFLSATLLMQSGAFVPGNYYQALMGENSREVKLTKLLAEGEDFEQVGIEWMT